MVLDGYKWMSFELNGHRPGWVYEVYGIEDIAFFHGFIYQGEKCEKK